MMTEKKLMDSRNNVGPGEKQWYLWVGGGVFVALVVIAVFFSSWGEKTAAPGGPAAPSAPGAPGAGDAVQPPAGGYEPTVPKDAVLTSPKNEAPASANPELDTKIRFFDLRATRGGFSPAELTVNQGDSLSVDFTAVDGDYDLDIPYLGAYFAVVRRGMTRKLPFDTSVPGTFAFQCRDHCPAGGTISGRLIVLPK